MSAFLVLGFIFVQAQTRTANPNGGGGEANDETHMTASVSKSKPANVVEPISGINVADEREYQDHIAGMLSRHDFKALEGAADSVRSGKSRFRGGVWKLYVFYEAVGEPAGGTQASDADWEAHISLVKRWVSLYPRSVTARVALAQTYLNYGEKARGTGFSDTVTDEGWKMYAERAEMARKTLEEADALPAKCPHWYAEMMVVALHQGWSKEDAKALLERAVSFEPGYYHTYREYSNYLLPRWYGSDAERIAFANDISARIGGDEGDFVYFEIATVSACVCDGNADMFRMSWPKIKGGYTALERRYGLSVLKMNRFAYVAMMKNDKEAAKTVFEQIGDRWEPRVWIQRDYFEAFKAGALRP